MCFVILKVACELAASLMVDAGHSHQDILFDERGLLLALGTPSSSLLAPPAATPSVWWNGPTQHLVP